MKRISYILAVMITLWTANSLSQPSGGMFRNLGQKINTPADEYLPVIYKDTLFFRRTDGKTGQSVLMTKVSGFNCSNPVVDFEFIKSSAFNNSEFNLSKTLQTNMSSPTFSKYSDSITKWEKPKQISELTSDANDFHPAFSITGDTIVFASTRPAGSNQSDLYVSIKNTKGQWSKPRKLSKSLNTNENEISPHIAADGTLYFASRGFRKGAAAVVLSGKQKSGSNYIAPPNNRQQGTVAGVESVVIPTGINAGLYIQESALNYDIIRAELGDNFWDNPEKLPFPINTEFDEFGPAEYNGQLFFASNRPASLDWGNAYGGFDLYGFCIDNFCDSSCSDFYLMCEITGAAIKETPFTKIEIIKSPQNELFKTIILENQLKYELRLPQNNEYIIRTYHTSLPKGMMEQTINHQCNTCCLDTIAIRTNIEGVCSTCIALNTIKGSVYVGKNLFSCGGYIEIFDEGFRLLKKIGIDENGQYSVDSLQPKQNYILRYHNDCVKTQPPYIEKKINDSKFNPKNESKTFTLDFEAPLECSNICNNALVRGRISCEPLNVFGYHPIIIKDKYGNIVGDAFTNVFGEFNSKIYNKCISDSLTLELKTDCAIGGKVQKVFALNCNKDSITKIDINVDFPKNCCVDCENILIEGRVQCEETGHFKNGIIELYRTYEFYPNEKVTTADIDSTGMFYIFAPYWPDYIIKYTAITNKNITMEQTVQTAYPCQKDLAEYVFVEFKLDEIGACKDLCEERMVSFYEYPIFMQGDYKPITRMNSLKIKDQADKYKINDKNAFVNLPLEKQAIMTSFIENDIDKKANQIVFHLKQLDKCPNSNYLMIKITGYPDEIEIDMSKMNLKEEVNNPNILLAPKSIIPANSALNPILLAQLRAYYTTLEIQRALINIEEYLDYADKIIWIAVAGEKGDGIGNPDIEIKPLKDKLTLPDLNKEYTRKLKPLSKIEK